MIDCHVHKPNEESSSENMQEPVQPPLKLVISLDPEKKDHPVISIDTETEQILSPREYEDDNKTAVLRIYSHILV